MQKMHRYATAALLAGVLSTSATAAVTLEGTRVVVKGSVQRSASIRAHNEGATPAMVQVWIDSGDGSDASEADDVPFRVTPSGPRVLQAGAGQTFRVTYAPRPSEVLPTDRESVLYFNLLDIPPAPDNVSQSTLQFAVRSRIKLFYRPPGIAGTASAAAAALEWSVHQDVDRRWLQIVNPGPYHVTLAGIFIPDEATLPNSMIVPRGTLLVPISRAQPAPEEARFRWIDDHGAAREHHSKIKSTHVAQKETTPY